MCCQTQRRARYVLPGWRLTPNAWRPTLPETASKRSDSPYGAFNCCLGIRLCVVTARPRRSLKAPDNASLRLKAPESALRHALASGAARTANTDHGAFLAVWAWASMTGRAGTTDVETSANRAANGRMRQRLHKWTSKHHHTSRRLSVKDDGND
eukprot:10989547-Alexandrium_andersonii.AAC.1